MTGRRSEEKAGSKRAKAAQKSGQKSVPKSVGKTQAKAAVGADSKRTRKIAIESTTEGASANTQTTAQVQDWVELFPQGISVATGLGRPVLILKDKTQTEVLPVWMNPLDAGVALAELSRASTGASPHSMSKRLLEMLEMRVESCTFVDLVGHHQWVQVAFRQGGELKILRVRAEDSMSFLLQFGLQPGLQAGPQPEMPSKMQPGLQSGVRFFASREYMARCRDLDFDLSKLEQSLVSGQLPDLQSELEISSKKQPYMM